MKNNKWEAGDRVISSLLICDDNGEIRIPIPEIGEVLIVDRNNTRFYNIDAEIRFLKEKINTLEDAIDMENNQ